MKTGIIILSRFDSRRFPGKALTPIAGRELLGRVVDRMRKVRNADALIIATSNRTVDDPIVQFAQKDNIECFRGDANDVAGRCHACCQDFKLDHFVRVCGDSPLIDPVLVMKLIDHMGISCRCYQQCFPKDLACG